MTPQTRNVVSGDAVIFTERFGIVTDPAIILVMGATASMIRWPVALCTRIASHCFQVIRFDHRDTGQSTTAPFGAASYAVEDMAGDVLAIMEAYGLQQAHLVGMSLGGYISQMLAVEHPERISSVTLFASEPLGWDGAPLPHISDALMAHFAGLASLDWSDTDAVRAFLLDIERLCAGSGKPFDAANILRRIEVS